MIAFQVIQVPPTDGMMARSYLPICFVINAYTYYLQTVFILLADFLHLRQSFEARTATTAPEIYQHRFSFEIGQAVYISLQVKQVTIRSLLLGGNRLGRK